MQPKISVIIPAYNEEKLITKCLTAFKDQRYPKEQFEVIVVDNGSKDKTAAVAGAFGFRVVSYTKIQGCSASRAFGAKNAQGDIIAFTDADAAPTSDWLEKIATIFQDNKIVCIGGRAVPNVSTVGFKIVFYFYDLLHYSHKLIGKPLMGGYNMAIRKSAYNAVGGFNTKLLSCDDWDLALRSSKHFGRKSVHYRLDLVVQASVRKLENQTSFMKYLRENLQNYYAMLIQGKRRVNPTFTVR